MLTCWSSILLLLVLNKIALRYLFLHQLRLTEFSKVNVNVCISLASSCIWMSFGWPAYTINLKVWIVAKGEKLQPVEDDVVNTLGAPFGTGATDACWSACQVWFVCVRILTAIKFSGWKHARTGWRRWNAVKLATFNGMGRMEGHLEKEECAQIRAGSSTYRGRIVLFCGRMTFVLSSHTVAFSEHETEQASVCRNSEQELGTSRWNWLFWVGCEFVCVDRKHAAGVNESSPCGRLFWLLCFCFCQVCFPEWTAIRE